MFGTMGQTNVKNLGNGGTMDGDVTITGDLTVSGGISLSLNEVLQGTSTIDITDTEALLVRKDGDGGDVFIVDTTNNDVTIGSSSLADGTLIIESNSSGDPKLQLTSTANRIGIMDFVEAGTLQGSIVYDHNGDNLKFATGSTNRTARFTVNETSSYFTSKLGIGCDHPSVPLEVELNGDTGTYFEGGGSGNDASDLRHLTITASTTTSAGDTHTLNAESGSGVLKFATSGSDRMIVNSSGVGIGTGSDTIDARLHVKGATDVARFQSSSGATNTLYTDSSDSLVGQIEFSASASQIVTRTSSTLSLGSNNVQTLHITDDDRVGIGITPTVDLDISSSSGDVQARLYRNANVKTSLTFKNSLQEWEIGNSVGDNNKFTIRDITDSRNAFVIDGSGDATFSNNVGIGVSPSANLHISNSSGAGHLILETTSASHGVLLDLRGSADRDAEIIFREGANAKAIIFNDASNNSLSLSDGSGGLSPVLNIKSGSVGIGISNPSDYFANYDNLVVGATSGSTGITIVSGDDSFGTIAFADGTNGQAEYEGEIQYRHSDNTLSLGVGGNRKMIIDSSGNTTFAGNQVIYADGNIAIPATKGLFFDGGTHTYISETSGDILKVHVANVICGTFRDSGFAIEPTSKLWFDGAGDTYIHEQSANKLDFFVGNGTRFVLDTNSRISLGNNDSSGSTTNTIFGRGAGNAIASGALGNTLIANDAGKLITTGNYNVLIGTSAGDAIVDSNNHVIIGTGAGGNGDIANDGVVAVGHVAAHAITSAQRITAIGYQALTAEDAGSYQTAVGYQALSQVNNDNGHNTALGQRAGYNLTTGNANTLIGSGADASANSGVNQTVVGQGATGQADNSVTLGNASVTAVYMAQDSGATVHCAGVNFPDTQVASSDANTLDDYEEGEYQPALSCSSSGTFGLDAGSNAFVYTKIGRQVHVQGEIQVTSESGSPSGDLRLTLPFTTAVTQTTDSSDIALGHLQLSGSGTTLAGQLYCRTQGGLNYMTFRMRNDDCSETVLDESSVDTNFYIGINLTYNA